VVLLTRHRLAPLGIFLVAIGLADRLAFFSPLGAGLIIAGFVVLALAAVRPDADDRYRDLVYSALFAALAVTSALAPFDPGPRDPALFGLTLASPLAFYVAGAVAVLRPFRLYLAGALLVAAHAAFIVHLPHPEHQDVYRFLNLGVDVLLRGHNPYGDIAVADGGPFRFTYPPGVLLLVAPFRVLLHDIRWAYVAAEGVTVLLISRLVASLQDGRRLDRWQEALVLVPLALPRASQAFYVYSNHEWLLLALAAGALYLALRHQWVWCGVLLALGIASKQYFLVFPVLFLLPVIRWRSLALGIAGAVAIIVPFLVWDWRAFFDKIFGALAIAPDPDRVTLWAILSALGANPGRAGALVMAAVGSLASLVLLARSGPDLGRALVRCGLALAIFTVFSSYAAYNYYVYALVFVTWGLLLQRRPEAGAEAATGSARGGLIKSDISSQILVFEDPG
jgi:hypothetical protein